MKITFLGAAKTVTGSCYLIEACGIFFTVDCGMYQGNSFIELRNFETQLYRAKELHFILLTHAHIDHSGLLPRIVKEGFRGHIYCTPPTQALVGLMLEDSAYISEMEAYWKNKKPSRQSKEVVPLYTIEEAKTVSKYVTSVAYNTTFEPYPGIQVTYHDAGHILGAAFIELVITEDNKPVRLVFSGDLGRSGTFLMHEPTFAQQADYLFIESTYGDRNHKDESSTLDELSEAIMYSYNNSDKVIIPAFAVGRTQEILYCLYLLIQQGKIPGDIPIFLDSPLAIHATELFKEYKDYLKKGIHPSFTDILDILPLKYTLSVKESKSINKRTGPAIVISASGMCNAGRIKHHLFNNAWRPGVSIIFVGYQALGTLGRKIVDGAKTIRIFHEDITVKARVYTLGGFSAHAGQQQLLDWIAKMMHPEMQVILIHGEEKAEEVLASLIKEKYTLPVYIPDYLEEIEVVHGKNRPVVHKNKKTEEIDWNVESEDIEHTLTTLRSQIKEIKQHQWEKQVDFYDRLLELKKELLSFLTYR